MTSSCKNGSGEAKTNPDTTPNSDHLTQSVLWFQRSAEIRALYFQGYNFAKYSLDNELKISKSKRKKAVIVDIDETVLNNSPYEAYMVLHDSSYSKRGWRNWVTRANADTLPGALGFLNHAKRKGVETFYISNRELSEAEPTLKNLQKFNFPFADEKHLLLRSDKSGKEERRQRVAKDYDIVLLCGDNLADFYSAFDTRDEGQMNDSIAKYRSLFGSRFIVLPNPMYGDWEKVIYGKGNLTKTQKDSARRAKLIGY